MQRISNQGLLRILHWVRCVGRENLNLFINVGHLRAYRIAQKGCVCNFWINNCAGLVI
jgi:hypothetical protein